MGMVVFVCKSGVLICVNIVGAVNNPNDKGVQQNINNCPKGIIGSMLAVQHQHKEKKNTAGVYWCFFTNVKSCFFFAKNIFHYDIKIFSVRMLIIWCWPTKGEVVTKCFLRDLLRKMSEAGNLKSWFVQRRLLAKRLKEKNGHWMEVS